MITETINGICYSGFPCQHKGPSETCLFVSCCLAKKDYGAEVMMCVECDRRFCKECDRDN